MSKLITAVKATASQKAKVLDKHFKVIKNIFLNKSGYII